MSDSAIFVAPFVGGLNTEQSSVVDLPTYTADELNCSIYSEGIRGRRLGMSIERDGQYYQLEKEGSTYSGYFWKNVGKTPTDFVVYQVDSILHFYKANIKPYSQNKIEQTVDISKYITDENNFHSFPVNYAVGDGKLMVVSKYMKPVLITYDFEKETFVAEEITIKYRDFEGVEDGLKIDEQPSELSNEHRYNLLNQGWQVNDIDQFFKDKSRYPANNLQWFIGKSESGEYNTEKLLQNYFGNTPAPKGHFILDYFDRNRSTVSGIFTGTARNAVYSYHSGWVSGRSLYYNPCYSFSVVFPSSEGTSTACEVKFTEIQRKVAKKAWGTYRNYIKFTIYGLNNNDEWVSVHSDKEFFEGPKSYLMNFTNATKYKQYKLVVAFDPGTTWWEAYPGGVTFTASLPIAEDGNPFPYTGSLDRVADVAYMAGKYFYLAGDTVLFSQTVTENNKGYDKCYQDADPTSESISDVVSTDGGYVKFQTMGDGMALKTFNRGVLVFGRDVVYGLLSPVEGRFTAIEYDTVELAKAGLTSAKSIVSVANYIYYWSPLGIFRIGVNMQTGSTMVAENITQGTIQSFYNNMPQFAKEHAKAAFDYCNNRIYWFYPLDGEKLTKLNGVLMYDLNYNAFCPFKLADGGAVVALFETVNSAEVAPTMYLRADGKRVIAGGQYVTAREQTNKYNRFVAVQHCIVTDDNKISLGDFNSREFIDWDSNGYDSYLVSRPIMIEGLSGYGSTVSGTYRNKQVPILQTLFERTEEEITKIKNKYIAQSGAYIRLRWGWSLDQHSNRWDLIQNAYRPQKDFMHDQYVESRIHVRGRGKAYQIEIRNDENKDFRLVGLNTLVRTA
jgi:hypothetical protein